MFVDQQQITTFRFANGTVCSGSEKQGNYKDYAKEPGKGCQFEGHLKDIITVPGNREKGRKAHWKLVLKSKAGTFAAKLNMSTNQAQDFFNSLASINDFTQPLRINVWQGEPYRKGDTAPTIVHLLRSWTDRRDFYRWKFPYLKEGDQPEAGVVYMPRAEQKVDQNGELLFKDSGHPDKDYRPVNKFIEKSIVDMIRAKLEGISEEVPGEDWIGETEDDLPKSFKDQEETQHDPSNEVNQKVNRNAQAMPMTSEQAPPPPVPQPEPYAELDELPF
jgi:hypothetical protein